MEDLILVALVPAIGALTTAVVFLWRQIYVTLRKRIATLEYEVKDLSESKAELNKKVLDLQIENASLLARMIAFVSSHDSSPLPMWIKDRDGKMIACNKAYETIFLKPIGKKMSDYINKTDFDIWEEPVAEAFQKRDKEVFQTEKVVDCMELVPSEENPARLIRVIKYPRYSPGIEQPFGVAGIAIMDTLESYA